MKNLIVGILCGFVLGTTISMVWAKVESGSATAISQVAYGKTGSTLNRVVLTSGGAIIPQ